MKLYRKDGFLNDHDRYSNPELECVLSLQARALSTK